MSDTKMTQNKEVMEHLLKHGHITSLEAFNRYGITRISARIFDLRKSGVAIETKQVTSRNRHGKLVTYADYRLAE